MNEDNEQAVLDHETAEAPGAAEAATEELLIEEVSIDGMCGVY